MVIEQRYCEVSDDDGHHFLIPADEREEWYNWVDSQDWDNKPEWAVRIDGRLSFTDPKVE